MKGINFILLLILIPFFSGCYFSELYYNPSWDDAAPCNQAHPWERAIGVEKAEDCCFPLSELSDQMPLTKLLDIALFNNPRTQRSWQAARAAAFGFRTSLSPYYPTISFVETLEVEDNTVGAFNRANITTTTSGVSAGTTSSTVATLTSELIFSYLLFDFGGRASQMELAAGVLFAANWQHNLDIQQVLLTVLNAYTSYLGNLGLLEANRKNVSDAQQVLKATKAMFNAGLVTKTDVLQAQSNKSKKELALIQADAAENTALGQLAVALGLPPQTRFSVENLPENLPTIDVAGNIEELFEFAKKHRPDLGIALAVIKQQEAQLGIAYSASMPQMSAFGSLNYTHFIHTPRLDGYDNILGLQINAPIFQGFYFVNQQKQIKAQIAEAVAALEVQVSQVALDIIANYYALKAATEEIPTTLDFFYFSEEAYRSLTAQYKIGTASILDLLNAQTNLSDARASVVLARTNWATARANLAFSIGILNDTDVKPVLEKRDNEHP